MSSKEDILLMCFRRRPLDGSRKFHYSTSILPIYVRPFLQHGIDELPVLCCIEQTWDSGTFGLDYKFLWSASGGLRPFDNLGFSLFWNYDRRIEASESSFMFRSKISPPPKVILHPK